MTLPVEMEGTYIWVVRLRYEALARNVLEGLVPFFVYHLGEDNDSQAHKVLSKWVARRLIQQATRRQQFWDTTTARVSERNQAEGGLDEGLDFLQFGHDILDAFRGALAFDLEMADARDIDDGATVAGALDDFDEC